MNENNNNFLIKNLGAIIGIIIALILSLMNSEEKVQPPPNAEPYLSGSV